ncbi:hypothetical protein Tco_1294699 [Tanacetum coccineum]
MEEASLHTTRKHLFISTQYYDKHGVPPTKRLFKVAMLDPVKEEDSITDVENAVFDLGVMDSLCFLFIDQRVLIGMITKFIKFIELNFSVITRGFNIKVCMLKGPVPRSNYDCTRGIELGRQRDLRKFANTGRIGDPPQISGERFCFQPISLIIDGHEYYICSSLNTGTPHEINAPHVKDFANLDRVLWHLITLRNFALTLTYVTSGVKVVGILVDRGPIET